MNSRTWASRTAATARRTAGSARKLNPPSLSRGRQSTYLARPARARAPAPAPEPVLPPELVGAQPGGRRMPLRVASTAFLTGVTSGSVAGPELASVVSTSGGGGAPSLVPPAAGVSPPALATLPGLSFPQPA